MSLFTQDDEKDWHIESHSAIAKELFLAHFPNDKVEEFIIENTMLNGNQILEHVLKPLIQNGQVKKLGYVNRSSNYKKDKYIVGVADNED